VSERVNMSLFNLCVTCFQIYCPGKVVQVDPVLKTDYKVSE
jgi:hypothetical protein